VIALPSSKNGDAQNPLRKPARRAAGGHGAVIAMPSSRGGLDRRVASWSSGGANCPLAQTGGGR